MAAAPWGDSPEHAAWLEAECDRLVRFARGARLPDGGFGWLDEVGTPMPDEPVHTWVTARMTHVFALARLRGDAEAGALVEHGLAALAGPLRDTAHGGWHPAVDRAGRPLLGAEQAGGKRLYDHAFVVLAAASACAAGHSAAPALLADALDTIERRFWEPNRGACAESWDRAWTAGEAYRGANSNMHTVEAFLAAADATGEDRWRTRALRIATRVVHEHARANHWRLIEHFDADWTPLFGYNRERPDDPFRPYGATVGHWFEWSRLLLGLAEALPDPPAWLRTDAAALFAAAVREGWHADGRAGFVYTLDWDGRPVVRTRMHWVLAEAIAAASALRRATGEADYDDWYRAWWEHADAVFLDREHGSWHHELDADGRPAATVWRGKPDAYHAVQATLLPRLPAAPTIAEALRRAARPVDADGFAHEPRGMGAGPAPGRSKGH
ncbi:AGE family epimerase/isomerase [Embleya sp. NBC_00896]|uniref:AGE family epimerase/isomerase n=1 Tax=Embleya sp. NBC_00896 TaxID=2975961 RepID=UPI002F90D365|nr:AGE family epimerase/isomerase [Embleya sp. NBC_00896]